MTIRPLAAALLLVVCGCRQDSGAVPASKAETEPAPAAAAPSAAPAPSFTNKVWVRSDASDLPGVMRTFLSDGTLVMDSCWETYRLAKWRSLPDGAIAWEEDGAEIQAQVVEASETSLVLRLALKGGETEERYRPADVPYVCPDMPR